MPITQYGSAQANRSFESPVAEQVLLSGCLNATEGSLGEAHVKLNALESVLFGQTLPAGGGDSLPPSGIAPTASRCRSAALALEQRISDIIAKL